MTPELYTFFTAMIPFLELKLAIPLGRELGLTLPTTYIFAITGAFIPGALTLALIMPISNLLRKNWKCMDIFFEKLFRKTRKEHTKKFNSYGALFLITLVAIPIPGSGAVTGALIAFVFGVNYWRAISMIFIGISISGILVSAGLESIFAILNLFA
jgi:uncharacterized membrane protein